MDKLRNPYLLLGVIAISILVGFQFEPKQKSADLKEDQQKIINSLQLSQRWFLNNINPQTKTMQYSYDPITDTYSENNNHIRQLGTLWAMTDLRPFLKSDALDSLIKDTLDYYLQFKVDEENYSYLEIDNSSPLAYNAFLILCLLNTPDYPQANTHMRRFAQGILSQQEDNGSYRTFFNSDRDTGQDFYPGESMLALMKLYELTNHKLYLDSSLKAFPFYRDYFRGNQNTAFVSWQTQSLFLAYQQTKDEDLTSFIFEMNDWLIDNHQIQHSDNPDLIGAFTKEEPRSVTAAYLEGINDAYKLALLRNDKIHERKYAHSIKTGAEFILKTQLIEVNSTALNPQKALGGFRYSLTNSRQRIDYTQHAISALIKSLQNGIFE